MQMTESLAICRLLRFEFVDNKDVGVVARVDITLEQFGRIECGLPDHVTTPTAVLTGTVAQVQRRPVP